MATKLSAARIATSAGVRTVITQGKYPENILKILNGELLGTQFDPAIPSENARKRWIANVLVPSGKLYLDPGAVKAISQGGKSLLPAGINSLEGIFAANDTVQLCDQAGQEIARGIVNYSSGEIEQVKGKKSADITLLLGYEGAQTIVHRDNLVLKREIYSRSQESGDRSQDGDAYYI
jgi:glutamate 5-kinase